MDPSVVMIYSNFSNECKQVINSNSHLTQKIYMLNIDNPNVRNRIKGIKLIPTIFLIYMNKIPNRVDVFEGTQKTIQILGKIFENDFGATSLSIPKKIIQSKIEEISEEDTSGEIDIQDRKKVRINSGVKKILPKIPRGEGHDKLRGLSSLTYNQKQNSDTDQEIVGKIEVKEEENMDIFGDLTMKDDGESGQDEDLSKVSRRSKTDELKKQAQEMIDERNRLEEN